MISASDIVQLPYSPDLTEAGIVYACRVLPRLHGPAGRGLYDAFRRTISATALQLAFQRYLTERGVPFDVTSSVPFADPERHAVRIGRRTCDLKSFLISRREQIDALAADPGLALRAPALVPLDRFAAEALRGEVVYVFALVTAAVGATGASTHAGRQHWIHSMPRAWIQPRTWAPLGRLALKSDVPVSLRLVLAGEDGSRIYHETIVDLPSGERTEVDVPFHSLFCLQADARPVGRIGVRSTARRDTHLIGPSDWQDAWLQGRNIWLLGWITREQFRMRARILPAGRRVLQFSKTKVRNLAVDVPDLKPIRRLLEGSGESAT